LDVGCAMGLLVEALRQRGADAFGVDVSKDAIQNAPPDIQPHCWVGSVTDPFPRKVDLIVCIGVLEHLPHREAEQAVENFCRHSDDVLFASTLLDYLDYKEATHFDLQPPEYWAELFARHGFFHDLDFDASFIAPWAVRFRKTREPVAGVVAAYERRFWRLWQENRARRELSIEQRNELAALRGKVQELTVQVDNWETRQAELEKSIAWSLLQRLQRLRARVAPPGSRREQLLDAVFRGLQLRSREAFIGLMCLIRQGISWQIRVFLWKARLFVTPRSRGQLIQIDPVEERPPVQAHQASVDIIVCVHDALPDVQRCLEAVVHHTNQPYSLILVDDGSESQTRDYLSEFASSQGAGLLRNEEAKGYTRAANQGLRRSSADCVVLLNSDTVVTPEWLDRLIACAESNPRIGLVGPLSNTASWQSIPEIESQGDWPANPLPAGMTIGEMGRLVTRYSARLYPPMPFLNGFCLLIRREVIEEIGYFDEQTFGAGYGEEDDYALRARKSGWLLALADDAYVYHAQSRSYSTEARRRLTKRAGTLLAEKHGQQIISEGVAVCRQDRVLEGIRARSRVMIARREWIEKGRIKFAGRRVLFVLPIAASGGGGNVVITEATAMREMGVDVRIFNLEANRHDFQRAYPKLGIPVLYGEREHLVTLASEYDAVIATANSSVEWLRTVIPSTGRRSELVEPPGHHPRGDRPVRGYYVQGFEPYMYQSGTEDFQIAWASYTLFPDLVRFTKTEWTRQEVRKQIGVECTVVGPSVSICLFRPRPRSGPRWPDRSLKIAAMVRSDSPYREPKLTMELLRQASRRYGGRVEIAVFGTSLGDSGFAELPRDFAWSFAGVLTQEQVAHLLNEVDIFVDFSSHQAMGLTALEAMACGAAVIVPERGGAVSFARHEGNSLVIDTSSPEACWHALQRLIEDHDLRSRLQRNALVEACDFFPERPALNILRALFDAKEVS
jgi:GT2 family glycosyltransferase